MAHWPVGLFGALILELNCQAVPGMSVTTLLNRRCKSDGRNKSACLKPSYVLWWVSDILRSCCVFHGLKTNTELLPHSPTPAALGPASVCGATGIARVRLVPYECGVIHELPEWILFWGLLALKFTVDQNVLLNTTLNTTILKAHWHRGLHNESVEACADVVR